VSNRRKARARDLPGQVAGSGGVPRALFVGPLIETWTGPVALSARGDTEESAAMAAAVAAMRRWSELRRGWLDQAGIADEHERHQLTPADGCPSRPWSAIHMTRSGEEAELLVSDRLAAAGAVLADVPELRREALELLELATEASPTPGARQVRPVRS
jgi:hypothetical protein